MSVYILSKAITTYLYDLKSTKRYNRKINIGNILSYSQTTRNNGPLITHVTIESFQVEILTDNRLMGPIWFGRDYPVNIACYHAIKAFPFFFFFSFFFLLLLLLGNVHNHKENSIVVTPYLNIIVHPIVNIMLSGSRLLKVS